jgi:hypothetical protein
VLKIFGPPVLLALVGFLVMSPRSPVVQKLPHATDVALMSFERAEAYTLVYRFLSGVKLPPGVIDFKANKPFDHEYFAGTKEIKPSNPKFRPRI